MSVTTKVLPGDEPAGIPAVCDVSMHSSAGLERLRNPGGYAGLAEKVD